MTWILAHLIKPSTHILSEDVKIMGEWSDSEIEKAAKEVKESLTPIEEFGTIDETELCDAIDIAKKFLPQPIREAL